MEYFTSNIKIAVTILVVVNPIGNSPIFLSITENKIGNREIRQLLRRL